MKNINQFRDGNFTYNSFFKQIKTNKMYQLKKSFFIVSICMLLGLSNAFAQTQKNPKAGDFVRIEMQDGTSYKGTINSINNSEISLDVQGTGVITIDRSLTEEVITYDLTNSARIFDFDNPLYSKYYLGESAIGLKKGEAYYQNIMIVGNFFAYGVSDNFSISGGFETVSLFNGRVPVFFVNPKLTFHSSNELIHFGVGTFAGFSLQDPTGFGGAAYTNVTFGNKNNNLTAGVGIPYASEGGFADLPVFQIAGMGRLSNKISLVGEVFIADISDIAFNDNTATFGTLNIRIMTKNAVFDVGAIGTTDGAIPVFSAAFIFD